MLTTSISNITDRYMSITIKDNMKINTIFIICLNEIEAILPKMMASESLYESWLYLTSRKHFVNHTQHILLTIRNIFC